MYRNFGATEEFRGLSDLHQNCMLSEILEGNSYSGLSPILA
jgi:hypothetical protein